MRKYLAAAICAAMLTACVAGTAVTAYADETEKAEVVSEKGDIQVSGMSDLSPRVYGDWVYTYPIYDTKEARIADYKGNEEDIELPSVIDDLQVTAIHVCWDNSENGFLYNNSSIKSVVIPDSVKSIEGGSKNAAFVNCSALTKVTVPASVTSISEGTFSNCPNLTIYGVKGSTAEDYALKNNIPFAEIGSSAVSNDNKSSEIVDDNKSSEVTSEKPAESAAPDLEEYFKKTVRNEYGSADTSDKTAAISNANISDSSWFKRKGNLGYTVDDFNNDGADEMLVYTFADNDKSSLSILSYKANEKGEISLADSISVLDQYNATVDYCVCETIEVRGKKHILIESIQNQSFFSNGQDVKYLIYDIDSNGKFVLKYRIGMDGPASYPIRYYLTTYSENMNAKTIIWSEETKQSKTSNQALQSAFKDIGFPATDKTVGDVLDLMGYKNYKKSYDDYPTYFFNDSAKVNFNVVKAPVDLTERSDGVYEFKSTVKYYSGTTGGNGNTGNTGNNGTTGTTGSNGTTGNNGNTSSTVTSPKTGSADKFGGLFAAILAGGAAAAFAGKKSKKENI